MGDGRNFRRQFYTKVGLHEAEEKRALESLFKEQPLDKNKFSHFSSRSVVPSSYRILVWKLLLGITPQYAESQDYVHRQHVLIFEDLWQVLRTLNLANSHTAEGSNGIMQDPSLYGTYERNRFVSESQNPDGEHYVLMWLISKTQLLYNPQQRLKTRENRGFVSIARKLSAFFDNPVDVFHMSSALWDHLLRNRKIIEDVLQDSIGMLRKENVMLHYHLFRLGLFSSTILLDECLALFSEIIPNIAFGKIVDKVIAGCFKVLSFVVVAMLDHHSQELSTVRTVEGIRNVLSQTKKEDGDRIINSAIDQWHKIGAIKSNH
ncbi:unnamed protein product [Meganyctiphanes norvegica]|uniref:TBC1 domain family member 7 n=1 Tax=Meganyctiphanes norvegica TaxID=48144 RepID=A0AAV2R179_MEGNR